MPLLLDIVFLFKFLYTTCGINNFLLFRIKGVAVGTYLNVKVLYG